MVTPFVPWADGWPHRRSSGRPPLGAIYASTLVRTQQTAAPLAAAHGLDVQVRAGLREVSAGELEMRSDADAMQLYLDTVFAWREGNLDLRMPGGESGAEVYARFDDIAAEATAEAVGTGVGTAVLVSHGAVIRSWCAARVDNVSIDYVARANVPNGSIVVLDGNPAKGWHALTWDGLAVP